MRILLPLLVIVGSTSYLLYRLNAWWVRRAVLAKATTIALANEKKAKTQATFFAKEHETLSSDRTGLSPWEHGPECKTCHPAAAVVVSPDEPDPALAQYWAQPFFGPPRVRKNYLEAMDCKCDICGSWQPGHEMNNEEQNLCQPCNMNEAYYRQVRYRESIDDANASGDVYEVCGDDVPILRFTEDVIHKALRTIHFGMVDKRRDL